MEDSSFDRLPEVSLEYGMFQMVVKGVSLIADMTIRAKHYALGKRIVKAVDDFLLGEPFISTERRVKQRIF